ncbi:MAG: rRNA adenine N-6-methyltransferase family protein, partial [Candidatus Thermoplasmatota archaeon]
IAKPGNGGYSRLSVMVQHRADVSILERVPSSAFHPQPEVDSAIVRMIPRPPDYRVEDEETFATLVSILFSHRRKKISTTLSMKAGVLGVQKEMALRVASRLGVSDARVEVMSPGELAALANALIRDQ